MDEHQISYEEIERELEERVTKCRNRLPHDIFDFSELILVALTLLLLLSSFLFRQTVVSGASMDPTLSQGERLVISNFFYTPKQNDIVVFQADEKIASSEKSTISLNEAVIKRVIATEGQTVSIRDGQVFVDNLPLMEDYLGSPVDTGSPYADMPPTVISEGHVFVMGDNRNCSLDSRAFGEVDVRYIVGKVLFRFYPFARFGGIS